ncbi:hypothetical protein AVEN_155481-1 [Araneus ventricosus]|uniref:Uncharacterized protein n=1 Tax=Araneus ventricosus TaxID=182803 RepID=A0A4Y2MKL7_ARAVE|nr:hypothetical protein AVEN_155481-1 [Araneus ventricosus]
MPCSCGNTTCPCGIPCYCSEESCKCHACSLALHRFCKICNKPLITDTQTDKDTCSCFVGESTALILENRDNPQCRMGNIPMPVGYFVCGELMVNMMIPVLRFPQRPICLMPPKPSIQANSRKILPSFISDEGVVTSLRPGEDSGIPSTAELQQLLDESSGQSSYHASSCICSTGAQNTEISCKETCPPLVLQSTDERKTANIVQDTKSEMEGRTIVQELSSIGSGNISYPVRLPNPTFCIAGSPDSTLKVGIPSCVAGPVHTIQTMTTFDEKCRQQAPSLNFESNDLAQADNVTTLQMNEKPLDPTKITEQSNLEINGERVEFEASLAIGTGNKFVFPVSGNSNATTLIQSSNEISETYLIHDKKLDTVSTEISFSGVQEPSGVQSQPVSAISTSAFRKNDCLQACPVDCSVAKAISTGEEWQNINYWSSRQIPSTTQSIPEYFAAPNTTSKLQPLFNKRSAQSSEENEYPQSGNSSSVLVNGKRNEEIDSIPLYIDTSTTQKMEKLLKSSKHSSVSSATLADVASLMQNSDANNFSNCIYL